MSSQFVPTVYVYEHCPYCIRVRVFMHIKKIAHKVEYLIHDDIKGHEDKVGAKVVPILEYAPGKFMKESMDIVKYLDNLAEYGTPILAERKDDAPGVQFAAAGVPNGLVFPRLLKVQPPLPEFATESAALYFKNKKEDYLKMTFEEAETHEQKYMEILKRNFDQLESELKEGTKGVQGDFYSINDIELFPRLWTASIIKGLKYPPKVKAYMDHYVQAGMALYKNQA